jgi:hypothetical protein
MMLGVVPGEELLAKAPGVLQGTEAIWKLRPVFHLNYAHDRRPERWSRSADAVRG